MEQTKPTAAQTLQGLNQALVNAFIKKEQALVDLKDAEAQILSIRNNLGGVQIGQQLQTEIDAEKLAALEAERKKNAPVPYTERARQDIRAAVAKEIHHN